MALRLCLRLEQRSALDVLQLRLCVRLEQRLDFLHPEDKILEQHGHMLQLCLRLRLCLHHHPHLCLQTI